MVRRYISVVSIRSLMLLGGPRGSGQRSRGAPVLRGFVGWSPGHSVLRAGTEGRHGRRRETGEMPTSVMWFRRDLRLGDNPARLEAVADGPVLPLFVLDPALWGPAGPSRRAYLGASLRSLDASLGELGGRLSVLRGDPVRRVVQAAREAGARRVHVAADFGPYGRRRDEAVEQALAEHG